MAKVAPWGLSICTTVGLMLAPQVCRAQEGQTDRGFVIRVNMAGRAGLVSSGTSSVAAGNALQFGLFGGGKVGRVMVGLGLDFSAFKDGNSSRGASASVLFTPELMVALARSADQRFEFLLDIGLGGGALISDGDVDAALLAYQIGPGVRFWPHRHFAVQALGGFGGQVYFPRPSGSNFSIHGIFGSIGLLGAL